jgi:hypothetical protein
VEKRDTGLLWTGLAITGAGAVLGLLVGALSDGDGGLWAFVGMGAGALCAIAVLTGYAIARY